MSQKLLVFAWLEKTILETGTEMFLTKGRKIKENGLMLNKVSTNYSHGEACFVT